MSSVHINNWVTVELIGNYGSQVVETVFCYKSGDMAITEGDAIAFGNAWITRMQTLLQNCLSANFQLMNVRVKTHFSEFPNVEAVVNFPANTFGSIAGDGSPGNVTLAVKLLTGIVGRSYRGRQFWPGIPEASTVLNAATSTFISLISQVFVQHLLGFSVASHVYTPAVASRSKQSIRALTSFAIDLWIDSQRRRLANRGR